jgi:DNA-binding cell septation regulator SpoVG
MQPPTESVPQKPTSIRILKIRQAGGGALRAFVDVAIGSSLIIHDFRIVQQLGQAAWVSPPQREYLDNDGKKRYATIVELSGALKTQIERAILSAWGGEVDRAS